MAEQHTDTSRLERICDIILQLRPESDDVGLTPNSLGGLQRLVQSALAASRAERPDQIGDAMRAMPVIGIINVDNPRDPRHKEWKP